jgi:hypothetical protein
LTRFESGSIISGVVAPAGAKLKRMPRALPVHVFQLGIRDRVVDDYDGARLRPQRRDGV